MKIVHLGKYYPPARGGIETHVQQLARGQAALGHDVTVVVVNHRTGGGQDVTHRVIAQTPTCRETDGDVKIIRVGRIGSFFKMDVTPGLRKVLRSVAVGDEIIWHLHTPNPNMLIAVMGMDIKHLVITHHSDIIQQRWRGLALRPVETSVYQRAQTILSCSPTYIAGSETLMRFPGKTACLPMGIDLQPYLDPSEAALDYAAQLREQYVGPLWLFVGRLIYYKALHIALQALQSVPGTLIVIGAGPLESKLKHMALELGVNGRVVWHASASDDQLVGAYQAANALWFPSNARSEGFGLVQVEAMASGCPVINTEVPHSGVSWVSRHMETGLTIPMNCPVALAAAANRLLDEPGLRDRLGEGARERAIEEFEFRLMSERSVAVYRNLESAEGNVKLVTAPHYEADKEPVPTSVTDSAMPSYRLRTPANRIESDQAQHGSESMLSSDAELNPRTPR